MFKNFKIAVQEKLQQMVSTNTILFVTDVDKDVIWDIYQNSFPEGTNPIFRERRAYDCNTCRQFIRPYGNIVAIENGQLVSIWDVQVEGYYQAVADRLASKVKSAPIKNIFVTKFAQLGTDYNSEQDKDGKIITWHHFSFKMPPSYVDRSSHSVEAIQGQYRDQRNVFQRSLEELTEEAINVTLELIDQNSLYRGAEFKGILELFLSYKQQYNSLPESERSNYCWVQTKVAPGSVTKIRNTSIGTLLVDLSEGKDLDQAVRAFEKVMAPANYKRPTAVLTKSMIANAEKAITELGLIDSLGRRYATIDDITVNNLLFANRDSKKALNVFQELSQEATVNPKKLSKVEEMSIDDFITNVIPKATNIEVLVEGKHSGNLMSLIAPTSVEAPSLFKWNNGFSWSYNNDVADSIKEAVKAQGGKVDGVLRFSIAWAEGDSSDNSDLDAWCIEPGGNKIYYGRKMGTTGGVLDVDITAPNNRGNKNIVENITWDSKRTMKKGIYQFKVHGWSVRGANKGFTAELEFDDQIFQFEYAKPMKSADLVTVVEVEFDGHDFRVVKSMASTEGIVPSREMWGVHTNQFQKASIIMKSPNHWDDQAVGNKHYFFILEGCKNPSTPRGFFNEFLKDSLMTQKRVFEALGSKMRVAPSDVQLSGLGFSSTSRNSLICKVEGAFTRTLKVNF